MVLVCVTCGALFLLCAVLRCVALRCFALRYVVCSATFRVVVCRCLFVSFCVGRCRVGVWRGALLGVALFWFASCCVV